VAGGALAFLTAVFLAVAFFVATDLRVVVFALMRFFTAVRGLIFLVVVLMFLFLHSKIINSLYRYQSNT
jgi:hypothetical protein